jgi:hypothetical protein
MSRNLSFFSLIVLFAACRNSGTPSAGVVGTATPPADFMEFYDKFHSDSLYQIAHITWPLQGESTVAVDSMRQRKVLKEWERDSWRMHHPVDFNSREFDRVFENLGDAIVIEKIRYAAANYGLERRFAKRTDGEWELIFYADMQEME